MGEVKKLLQDIAELAAGEMEDWIEIGFDEWIGLSPQDKKYAIRENLDVFFYEYGEGIAEEMGVTEDEFDEFLYDHQAMLVDMIAKEAD